MPDPFENSRRRITWAKNQFAKLEGEIKLFQQQGPCEIVTEPDLKKPEHLVYKLRLTSQVPDPVIEITEYIIYDLRSALDLAIYDVAVAAGCAAPRHAYFPFAGDAADLELKLRGNCKDVPEEIFPLLRSYEPYKGGSEPLWALNKISVANKHKFLTAVGSASFAKGLFIEGIGLISMPQVPTWDRAKQEMELYTAAPGAQLKGQFAIGVYIAFGEVEGVTGRPVFETLKHFIAMVELIVNEVEAETRRLGFL
jgi:hypothetical protein